VEIHGFHLANTIPRKNGVFLLFSGAKKVSKKSPALCIIHLPKSVLVRKFEKLVVPSQTVPNFFWLSTFGSQVNYTRRYLILRKKKFLILN